MSCGVIPPAVPRTWTLAQANAALPEVVAMLKALRTARSTVLEIDAHLKDLLIVHGPRVRHEGEGHAEWTRLAKQRIQAHKGLHDALDAFRRQGIEVKDVDAGLVDFWAEKGAQRVFLCWKEGEDRVAAWHEVDAGFAGRKPVPDVPAP